MDVNASCAWEMAAARPDQGNKALVLSYLDTLTESVAKMSSLDRDNFAVALTELQWANECIGRLFSLNQEATGTAAVLGTSKAGLERRMNKRYIADRTISMRLDQAASSGRLLDISQTGVRFVANGTWRPGKIFRLKLTDESEVSARVIWSTEEAVGASFLNHLAHMRQVSRFIISHAY